LLYVLPILALLAVLLLALLSVLRLEHQATVNVLEGRRARAVAEAGIEQALVLLADSELTQPRASLQRAWAYRNQGGDGWGYDLPLEEAASPSFQTDVLPGGVAVSGLVSRTLGPDVFSLKIVDCSARLNLNARGVTAGQLDALGRAILDHDRLRRTPGSLHHDPGWAAWAEASGRVEFDPVAGRGAQLLALRGRLGGAFVELEQLAEVLDPEALERLSHHVTLDGWLDRVRRQAGVVCVNTATWPVLVAMLEGFEKRGEVITPEDARGFADLIDARRRGARPFLTHDELRGIGGGSPPFRARASAFGFVTYGRFEVTSLGRIFTADGREIAQEKLRAVVSVYEPVRLRSQEDFEMVRADDDAWSVESHPNPVAGLAGPRRFRMGGVKTLSYEVNDPKRRKRLRWKTAHPSNGWLQPGYEEITVPFPASKVEGVHVFRFNPDLKSEIYIAGALSELMDRPEPSRVLNNPDAPLDGMIDYSTKSGIPLAQIGETPTGPDPLALADVQYWVEVGPDGLVSGPGSRDDLRYPNRPAGRGFPLASSSMAIQLRFKLDEADALGPGVAGVAPASAGFAPLLEARVRPDERYVGGSSDDPITGVVDLQVEARAGGGGLEVRTRITSSRLPVVTDPDLPPELALDQALVEQRFRIPGAKAGEWNHLYMPIYLNAHTVHVNGVPGEPLPPLPWPAPTWATMPLDTVVPGGLTEGNVGRPQVRVDDMVITRFKGEGGLHALKSALPPPPPDAVPPEEEPVPVPSGFGPPGMPMRHDRIGSDLLGRLRGELAPFGQGRPKVGAMVWAESIPKRWFAHRYEPFDFLTQITYLVGEGPLRRQLCDRRIPPPKFERLADPLVRTWRLRYLAEREVRLSAAVAQQQRLAVLASHPEAPRPQAVQAINRLEQELAADLQSVLDESSRIREVYGDALPAWPGEEITAAFDPREELPADRGTLRFELDFVFLSQLAPRGEQDASTVEELTIPVATTPRILREGPAP
jgi:hypothetical protein